MGGNARAEVTVMLGGVNEGMEVFAGRAGLGKAVLLLGMRWVARGGCSGERGARATHTKPRQ